MNIKRIFLASIIVAAASFPTTFAAHYPHYLYDNPSYPMVDAHMDTATYLDDDSVVLKYKSDHGVIWAQYQIFAKFDYDYSTGNENLRNVDKPKLLWFYMPADPNNHCHSLVNIDGRSYILPPFIENIAYVSYDSGAHWDPFYTNDTTGCNYTLYKGFWMGINIVESKLL